MVVDIVPIWLRLIWSVVGCNFRCCRWSESISSMIDLIIAVSAADRYISQSASALVIRGYRWCDIWSIFNLMYWWLVDHLTSFNINSCWLWWLMLSIVVELSVLVQPFEPPMDISRFEYMMINYFPLFPIDWRRSPRSSVNRFRLSWFYRSVYCIHSIGSTIVSHDCFGVRIDRAIDIRFR